MNPQLKVEGLTKTFRSGNRNIDVLHNFNLEVAAGGNAGNCRPLRFG